VQGVVTTQVPPPEARTGGFAAIQMLVACCIIAVVAAMASPMMTNMLAYYRLSGDANNVFNTLAVAKMRAASDFTKTRLYVNISASSAHVEVWQKTSSTWSTEAESTTLSSNDAFSYGIVTTPPPNTQGTIGQSAQCLNNAGTAIGGTACVLFNSRGLPVDTSGTPIGTNAIYLKDSTNTIYAITIAATGLPRLWRAQPIAASPSWVLQ
jgi:Tfp pilus assembly protein FimT